MAGKKQENRQRKPAGLVTMREGYWRRSAMQGFDGVPLWKKRVLVWPNHGHAGHDGVAVI